MLKLAGVPCPLCNEPFPAEYMEMEGPAKWKCHKCQGAGELAGPFTFGHQGKVTAPAGPKPTYKGLVRGFLLFIGFIFFLETVMGGMIARRGDSWIRLTTNECSIPAVVENLLRNKLDVADFHHGYAHIRGRDWKLCWLRAPFGAVLVFEDGDVRQLRSDEMEDDPGV